MRWNDILSTALVDGLARHRLRTLLSVLGVMFGVAAVIAMSGIGAGAKEEALDQIRQLGINNIRVSDAALEGEKLLEARRQGSWGLSIDDAKALKEIVPTVVSSVPVRTVEASVTRGQAEAAHARVVGTTDEFIVPMDWPVAAGRFLEAADVTNVNKVCVLGEAVRRDLFGEEGKAVGEVISVGFSPYVIVGVMSPRHMVEGKVKALSVADSNYDVYVPVTAAIYTFAHERYVSELTEISLTIDDEDLLRESAAAIHRVVSLRHREADDFSVMVPQELLEQAQATQRVFNMVMGAIAGISLLVGGIGIMNIMLAGVSERTREIGIRRAVGASRKDILLHFVTEAVCVSALGGLLGLAVGWALVKAIALYTGWRVLIAPGFVLLALCVSGAVGLTFGIFPAWQAARIDPAEAVRRE
ncbi:MAG: FtsX-like permease family protein [Candidatus Brocadiaceae bacterium]|nr:FtsX-like permease family protein [Candidatus Brocadiaceae bacterium]